MAAPLAAAMATLGGLVGYGLQRHGRDPARAGGCTRWRSSSLPLLLGVETVSTPAPAVTPVRTSVIVAAPPEVVWSHVVSFAELPPPRELLFRSGIAYPTSARIEGEGVGAIRRCRFSTGDFVEPITRWDEPRLLAFSVASQPAPMRELSPWGAHPSAAPRRLPPLAARGVPPPRASRWPDAAGGTTWYENRMWPAAILEALVGRADPSDPPAGARARGARGRERAVRPARTRLVRLNKLLTRRVGEPSRSGNRFSADEHPRTRSPRRQGLPRRGRARPCDRPSRVADVRQQPDVPDALAVRSGFLRGRRIVPAEAIGEIDEGTPRDRPLGVRESIRKFL